LQGAARLDAIIPVHAFGQMADMKSLATLAEEHGVPVIEDAACALGAKLEGRAAGAWGTLGCFSFHPRKAATTGEGGAVRTADAALSRQVRVLRNHGQDPAAPSSDFIAPGFNLRLTEFQAALGVSQLSRYPEIVAARRARARRYAELLADFPLTLPAAADPDSHIFQSYVVRLDDEVAGRRDEILARLKHDGVEANIGTHHMPLITYYRREFGFRHGDFPVTDAIAASAVALPMHSFLSSADQEQVADSLRRAISS